MASLLSQSFQHQIPNNLQDAYNAAKKGKVRQLVKLLKSGIDVNYKYELDLTLLHLASQYGHVTVVNELLNYGADNDAKSILGCTPLHNAAFCDQNHIVTKLLNNGANINLPNNEGYTALHIVSRNGNLEIVKKLLKQKVEFNRKTNKGCTPLHLSSENCHLNIIIELLNHGADVNLSDNEENTPLHYASIAGHVTIVTELSKHGADVNCKNKDDVTPLSFASEYGHVTIVTELIKQGADVNYKNEDYNTPLIFASQNNHLAIVTELIKYGADIHCNNKDNDTAIIFASENGHVSIVSELIKYGADINCKNKDDGTPLIYASQNGHVTIVTELIKHGVDVNCKNKDDRTPLIYASQNGHMTIVTELIKHGAYVNCKNKDGDTPLIYASENGYVTIVTELIKHGADVNCKIRNDSTPIMFASQNGHVTTITELIKHGADVNFKNKKNVTPLMFASQNDHVTTVTELIKHGANVNCKDKNDVTPLNIASAKGHLDIVTELISHGAIVNIKNKDDDTPLSFASQIGDLAIVTELIKHGADVNFKNKNYETPLHFASFKGHVTIVSELIMHGADVNYKDRDDNTPLHYASLQGHVVIVNDLISHGAVINSKNIQNETPLYFGSQKGHLPLIIELLKHGGDLNFKINPDKSFLFWASENGYNIREHDLLLEPLLKKTFSENVFMILSELYLYSLPEELEPVLQTIVFLIMNIFSLSELLNPDSNNIIHLFDIEMFFIKLFGYGFMKEFISSFENINKTDKTSSSPSEINLPGIGKITSHELIEIAKQFYHLPNDFCKLFLPNFQKLFKFAYVSNSHDFQINSFEIFGCDFTKDYQSAIDSFLEEYQYSLSFSGLELQSNETFSQNLTQNIQSFGFQTVLSKIGGAITGTMIASVEPIFVNIYNISLNDEEINVSENYIIPLEIESNFLQQELFKLLVCDFKKHFQPPYVRIYKAALQSSCLPDLDIQGSAGEGFLIYGKDKSDIDFIYSFNIFNASLKFNNLITCPDAPAYIMISVMPDLSECKNEIEKEIIEHLKYKNEAYFLNIKHVKHLMCQKELKQFSPDHQVLINSEDGTCFRIQFFYNAISVMIDHFTDNISNLGKLSDSFVINTGLKPALETFLKGISGKFYVSQMKWEYFRSRLQLCLDDLAARSSYPPDYPSSARESYLKIKNFNIDIEIEKKIHFIFDSINSSLQFLGTNDINFKLWVHIDEEIFYLLIFILISWGLYSIIPIILDTFYDFGLQLNDGMNSNFVSNGKVTFLHKQITKILNMDLSSICNKELTHKQKQIEIYVLAALLWIKREFEKISLNFSKEDKPKTNLSDIHNFTIHKNDYLIKGNAKHKYSWHSSMIILIIEILNIVRNIMKYNNMLNQTIIEEHKHMFEVIPGIKFEGWPIIASSWINRQRFWPESSVIQRMVNNGYYVVFKSLKQNKEYEGRISFSSAENIICHAMTKEQRSVFYYLKTRFKLINTKHLTSYHIKSLCFWVYESMPLICYSEDIKMKYIEAIISKLFTALQDHMLSHYFIPEHNLLMDLTDDDYEEINEGIKNFIENHGFEIPNNRGGQCYKRGETTNIEFLFRLVEESFYKSVEYHFRII